MNLAWLYLINTVLLSRLPFVSRDAKIQGPEIFVACLVQQISLLVFELNWTVLVLSILLVTLSVIWWLLERSASKEKRRATGQRLLLLSLYFLVTSVVAAHHTSLRFHPELPWIQHAVGYYLAPFANVSLDPVVVQVYLFGILLCITEGNLLVRFIVQRVDLPPEKHRHSRKEGDGESSTPEDAPLQVPAAGAQLDVIAQDSKAEAAAIEYRRGRVIGIFERLIVLALLLQVQFSALGFVLAAKALARSKKLSNDDDFAEYFLIGTLASITIAGVIALITLKMLALHQNWMEVEQLHTDSI